MHQVAEALRKSGYKVKGTNLVYNAKSTVKVTGQDAVKVLKLQNDLEDHDDVNNVYSNFEMDESEMEKIASELE